MVTAVVMPQMGLEVTEGTVAAIRVAPGASVAEGETLVEMETDKAVTDVVAPRAGVVRAVEVEVGDTVAIGATLVVIADDADEPLDVGPASEPPVAATEAAGDDTPAPGDAGVPAATGDGRTADGRVRAAPVARRAALRLGVDLESVEGTGPRGRITLRDVERAAAAANGAGGPAPAAAPVEEPAPGDGERLVPVSAVRRTIARRMASSQQIPQFVLERELDATWLLAQKEALRGTGAGVTDLVLQAMAEVALRHPDVAASYVDGDTPMLRRRDTVDIGLAVATARGLLVPVVRRAHERSLTEIAAERARLVGAARSGRLAPRDMGEATMTLSNLGGFGIDRFTAMVNPGEAMILAIGRVVERVVPRERALAVIPTISLSLTVDHRVADGATAAAALVELAELLEGGMTWRR